MPSAFVGMVLGMYLVMFLALFALPIAGEASANPLCEGNFPCFSPAACQKAGGAYAACADKCGNPNRGYCYAQQEPVPLTIRIGSIREVVDLGAYIQAVYTYAIGVAAVLAAVMMMIGGIQWLTAAGDSGRVSSAKGRITNAVIGLLLTIFAWVFLNTINPSLVRLQMPRIPMVKKAGFVTCDQFKMQKACGHPFGLVENEGAAEDATDTERYTTVDDPNGPDVITECVGASCGMAGFDDGTSTCQRAAAGGSSDTSTTTASGGGTGPGPGYACVSCLTQDQSCTNLGANEQCCGRFCGATDDSISSITSRIGAGGTLEAATEAFGEGLAGLCSNGMNGSKCGSSAECMGGKCVDVSDYFQGLTSVTTLATGIWDVLAGTAQGDFERALRGARDVQFSPFAGVASIWAGGMCSNGSMGAPCNTSSDCGAGLVCLDDTGVHVCSRPVPGGYCSEDAHCGSYRCNETIGVCVTGENQAVAEQGECSVGHNGSSPNNDYCTRYWGEGYRCQSVDHQWICINGQPGSLCTADSHCQLNGNTGTCYQGAILDTAPDVGICIEGTDGSGCDGDEDCDSRHCFNNEGFGQLCIGPSESGGPCDPEGPDSQCQEGMECNDNSHTCLPAS